MTYVEAESASSTNVGLKREPPINHYSETGETQGVTFALESSVDEVNRAETPGTNIEVFHQYSQTIMLKVQYLWAHFTLSIVLTTMLFTLTVYTWLTDELYHPLLWLTGAFSALGVAISAGLQIYKHSRAQFYLRKKTHAAMVG